MTWITGVLIFAVGTLTGFFANRFLSLSSRQQQALQNELQQNQQEQDALKQELSNYLAGVEQSFKTLAEQAMQAAQTANTFGASVKASDSKGEDFIPYFGSDVSEGLKETKPVEQLSKTVQKSDETNAPLDYSAGNSGILVSEESK
ncbi:hypothetical protein C2869_20545 [Saccharobesus litoralis]|uniref:Z-ring associated protein G n=1 Tax=Saccharobesus litoralis TaxID=2172099 RepID=A0A2S0VWN9_9ALTE|nr:DUF1043 family protein [Saccharobesus litoralis]AWB68636.1 hypothetical protein C2869_20545 [Saccharobesus litoralis]